MNRLFMASLSLAGVLVTAPAFADHAGPRSGAVYQLRQQSRYLHQLVRSHQMAYTVQQAVSRFVLDVDQLSYCNPNFSGSSCGFERNRVRQSFYQVERYLYDSGYNYPQVYQQFRTVQRLVNITCGGGNGPGPGPFPPPQSFRCIAIDNGWEEHGGGHQGYARSLQLAQRQALYECQRFHGACRIQRCDRVN